MSDLSKRVAALSPEKRDLLLRRLREREQGQPRPAAALPLIEPDLERRHLPFPLSDVQQTYWIGQSGLFDLHSRGTRIYMAYDFSGISSAFAGMLLRRLDTALLQMIDRHDMLRAIVLPDGRQQILPRVPPYRVPVENLRGRDRRQVEAALASARERMCRRSPALDRWPLFELLAQRLGGGRMRLHIAIDALLIDGTSRLMLLDELFQRLSAPERAFPPLPCSYRDYVLAWAAFQESEPYARARDYWLNRLPGLPPAPALPLAQPIGPQTPNQAVNRSFEIEPQTWQQLKARAAQAGLSPSGVATAAFVEVLAAWSDSARFTISLVGTYRPPLHPRIDEIIGNFNTIYLLAVDHTQDTFEARAKRLQEQITTDLEYRYFSGFQVLRELNRRRGGSSRAAMPIFFNSVIEYSHPSYQLSHGGADSAASDGPSSRRGRLRERLGGLLARRVLRLYQQVAPAPQVREVEVNLLGSQILLAPTVGESGDGTFSCLWQSVEHVFPDGLMEAMMNAYMRLLRRLADDEACWQLRVPLLTQQRAQWAVLDTTAAPPAGQAGSDQPKTFVAPRDPRERQLVQIWEAVLDTRPIGVTDHFFDLGGNSFLAARMIALVQQQLGPVISPHRFFDAATIAHLAGMIGPPLECQ